MNSFIVRDATLEDVTTLADLIIAAWQTAYTGIIDPELPKMLKPDRYQNIFTTMISEKKEIIYVYSQDSQVKGFISGKILPDEEYDCQVQGLYVHPDHQGHGIGSQLFDKMKDYFLINKCRRMIIWTLLGARNNSFYRKNGGIEKEYKELEIGKKQYPGVGFVFWLQ